MYLHIRNNTDVEGALNTLQEVYREWTEWRLTANFLGVDQKICTNRVRIVKYI